VLFVLDLDPTSRTSTHLELLRSKLYRQLAGPGCRFTPILQFFSTDISHDLLRAHLAKEVSWHELLLLIHLSGDEGARA
jgi:hypothetical protein